MQPITPRAIARLAGSGLLGAVVGVVGTAVHRFAPPWGLLLALACVLAAAVLTRAWAGWSGMLALALGVATVVGLLGGSGPGGDVVVAQQPLGYAWYLGVLLVPLAGLLPARWFRDAPPAGATTAPGGTAHVPEVPGSRRSGT